MHDVTFHGHIPVIPDNQIYLERPRVHQCLEKALESPIVSVVAGAGYGKTHAVYSYLRKNATTAFWLQISERDNLEQRFWENLLGAISSYHRDVGAKLRELDFPSTLRQFDRYRSFLEKAMNPRRKYIVVLDDCHLLHSKAVLRFCQWSAEAPFLNIQGIMIFRIEPNLNFIPLVSKGLVAGITADDLRFSEQEIHDYFKLQNIELDADAIKQILQDTEGWAMAVDLIARERRKNNQAELSNFTSLLKNNAFKDIEQVVFTGIDEKLKKFLIKLSLLEHRPPELLEKIESNRDFFSAMVQISPFIRYDAYQNEYRIHHLFLEFLTKRQNELTGEEIREVYSRAAEWCVANNQLMDAALDYERARNYQGFLGIILSFPRLLPDRAAKFFLECINRLLSLHAPQGPPGTGMDEESMAAIFLYYVIKAKIFLALGRFEDSAQLSREAIAKFEPLPPGAYRARILSASYNNLGFIAVLSVIVTKDRNFIHWFEQARRYYMEFPQPVSKNESCSNISSYICRVGYPAEKEEFERSLEALTAIIPLVAEVNNGFFYGLDSLGWAELAYYRGDLDNAEKFAFQAVYKAREKNQYEIESRGLFYLLRLSLHKGKTRETEEILKELNTQLEKKDYLNRYTFYDISSGWYYAQIGEKSKLGAWLKNEYWDNKSNTLFYRNFEVLIKAKCFFAAGYYSEALTVLEEFQKNKKPLENFLLGNIEMTVLRAACLYRRKNDAEGRAALEAAYEMACSNSLIMPFIELGEDMRLLAGEALNSPNCSIPRPWLETIRGKASAYGKKLFLAAEENRSSLPEQAAPALTWREREVLKALSRGWNREKIAGNLATSVNTVKAEISSVYTKLGAQNRADAVRIAGKLNIFSR
ncbi:MAG: LuxR C-terminal-related transcriptional regulator [Treponema sp.]|jgi:LuxR family maltose regulon positive regulatory protein|nr:LuxR C-terminal-related transcriptional regulator [Treponema sp.]